MLKHVKFANLPVRDQDRAMAFYRDKVGLGVATDEPYSEGWRWIEMEIPGAATRVLFVRREDEALSDAPTLVLVCDDVPASFRELAAKGVAFEQEPAEAPWRPGELYAIMRDSEGNLVLLDNG
jgi:predicted enzyme related to lactoylglutathione lyase